MTSSQDIARGIAPCWGNGIAGPKECDEVYQCELHFRLADALVEFGEAEYARGIKVGYERAKDDFNVHD